jgi:hypothetical protein
VVRQGFALLVVAVLGFAIASNAAIGGAQRVRLNDLDPAPTPRSVVVKAKKPRITAVLPAGWSLSEGVPQTSTLVTMRIDLPGIFWDPGVSFHRALRLHDPRTHEAVPFPQDFIGWLGRHPRLRTARRMPIRVGGVPGERIDIVAMSVDPKGQGEELCGPPGSAGGPCLPLSADATADEHWGSMALDQGQRARMIYLRTPRWKLIIWEDLPKSRSLDAQWLGTFEPVLRSIRFG